MVNFVHFDFALTALINIVNFYLDENKPRDLQTLASKAKLDAQDETALKGLISEAIRKMASSSSCAT